jgi:hypothetical protein
LQSGLLTRAQAEAILKKQFKMQWQQKIF